jgi:hypothetical protein
LKKRSITSTFIAKAAQQYPKKNPEGVIPPDKSDCLSNRLIKTISTNPKEIMARKVLKQTTIPGFTTQFITKVFIAKNLNKR